MATVQDIEASKNSTDANHTDVGGLPSQQKGIKEGFEDLLSYNRKNFEISQKGSEERLGVLLLLHYKSALDKLNLQYREFSEAKRVPDREVMETAGQYIQARDLYQSHLEHFPSSKYKTQEEYESMIIDVGARIFSLLSSIHSRIYQVAFVNWVTDSKSEILKSVDDLKVDYSSRWSLNYFWYPVFRHGWRRGVLLDETAQDTAEFLSAVQTRCLSALVGGFALIVPMLIMKLHPTTLTVCLTTTIAVILAASLLVLFGLKSSPKDLVGITAAYAAVLVVFVGASTTDRGADNKYVAKVMGTLVGIVITIVLIVLGCLQYRWYQVRRALDSWEVISMGSETEIRSGRHLKMSEMLPKKQ